MKKAILIISLVLLLVVISGCPGRSYGKEPPVRQLTTHTANDWVPAWSPDSRKIAFHSVRTGNSDIWVLTLE